MHVVQAPPAYSNSNLCVYYVAYYLLYLYYMIKNQICSSRVIKLTFRYRPIKVTCV